MNSFIIALILYFSFGIFLAYLNFTVPVKFISDFCDKKYKSKRFSNGIRNIVYFNNVKFIFASLDFFFFFSLFYPLLFIGSILNYNSIEYYFKKISFFQLPLIIIGELPAYKSRKKIKGKDTYYSIYTLNGKSKLYKNNKLHEESKAWLIKEDNNIRPAISNVSFYHSENGTKKFNFEHKERFFYEGKEIKKMLHSELLKKITQNKINNF